MTLKETEQIKKKKKISIWFYETKQNSRLTSKKKKKTFQEIKMKWQKRNALRTRKDTSGGW